MTAVPKSARHSASEASSLASSSSAAIHTSRCTPAGDSTGPDGWGDPQWTQLLRLPSSSALTPCFPRSPPVRHPLPERAERTQYLFNRALQEVRFLLFPTHSSQRVCFWVP